MILELWDGAVTIAMAGPDQLWVLDLEKDDVGVLAGSGMENLADGPAPLVAMAQPSGLSSDGEKLWVVESETSSLRYLDRSGCILTVVGTGLFDFGYRDGPAARALLQHPLGVVATSEGPVVCDTYNSALRRYDGQKNELTTIAREALSEPSGAALLDGAGGDLVVADTDNHRLVRVGPGGEVRPFEVRGLRPPVPIPERGPVTAEIGPVELAGWS